MVEQKQKNRKMAGKLSDLEFACAVATLRLPPDALAAARRVLVDGETQVAVGLASAMHKQAIYRWVSRVNKAHTDQMRAMAEAVPADWSAAILALPSDQMQKVKAQADVALATLRAEEVGHG